MQGEEPQTQSPPSRGLFWPIFLAGLLFASVGGNVVMMLIATGDPAFSVEENYYQKGLRWGETRAQETKNSELGWRLALQIRRLAGSVPPLVRVALTDREKKPIDDAKVHLVAFHNARAAKKLEAQLRFNSGEYLAKLPIARAGLWEFRFVVEREGQRFTKTIRRKVSL
ncbi:MAG: FixH family protein [Myxococcales bacterium]|nr:FixH family protein [Myxococcales bacterium]